MPEAPKPAIPGTGNPMMDMLGGIAQQKMAQAEEAANARHKDLMEILRKILAVLEQSFL